MWNKITAVLFIVTSCGEGFGVVKHQRFHLTATIRISNNPDPTLRRLGRQLVQQASPLSVEADGDGVESAADRSAFEVALFETCRRRQGAKALELLRRLSGLNFYSKPADERFFRNKALRWLGASCQWYHVVQAVADELDASADAGTDASGGGGGRRCAAPPPPDDFTWGMVLTALSGAQPPRWREAVGLLDDMAATAGANEVHVGLALKACVRAGRPAEALALLRRAEALTGRPPSLQLWNQVRRPRVLVWARARAEDGAPGTAGGRLHRGRAF